MSSEQFEPDRWYFFGTVLQVDFGVFSEDEAAQGTDPKKYGHWWVKKFLLGVPHGNDLNVQKAHTSALKDAALRQRFANHPKRELTRLLDYESAHRPGEVAPPYTFFLLRKDGSVVDMSDKHICPLP